MTTSDETFLTHTLNKTVSGDPYKISLDVLFIGLLQMIAWHHYSMVHMAGGRPGPR